MHVLTRRGGRSVLQSKYGSPPVFIYYHAPTAAWYVGSSHTSTADVLAKSASDTASGATGCADAASDWSVYADGEWRAEPALSLSCGEYGRVCQESTYVASGFSNPALNGIWTLVSPDPALPAHRGRPVFWHAASGYYLYYSHAGHAEGDRVWLIGLSYLHTATQAESRSDPGDPETVGYTYLIWCLSSPHLMPHAHPPPLFPPSPPSRPT